jgi:hypothetical protein
MSDISAFIVKLQQAQCSPSPIFSGVSFTQAIINYVPPPMLSHQPPNVQRLAGLTGFSGRDHSSERDSKLRNK